MLERLVATLALQQGVALARVWLVEPGDECGTCPMRQECPGQVPCLQLRASAGSSLQGGRWERTTGDFRRFPIGGKKIGAAGRGESVVANDLAHGSRLLARPWWAAREKVEAMVAHPLAVGGEVLGVLALFLRRPIEASEARALRMLADQAAALIAPLRRWAPLEARLRELQRENARLRDRQARERLEGGLIGDSPALKLALDQARLLADAGGPVLVLGEPGTGKGLYAQAIHERSERGARPLVRVDAADADAQSLQDGLDLSEGGTLQLDAIDALAPDLQAALARRLAPPSPDRDATRVIATSAEDLRGLAVAGRFHQELYLRLAPLTLVAPPLRERKPDLLALANHVAQHAAARLGLRSPPPLGPESAKLLESQAWRGNAKELTRVVQLALLLGEGGHLELGAALQGAGKARAGDKRLLSELELRALERENLSRALQKSSGRVYGQGGAAALLGLPPTTLISRMKALGVPAEREPTSSRRRAQAR